MKKRFIVQFVAIFVLLSILVAPVFTGYANTDVKNTKAQTQNVKRPETDFILDFSKDKFDKVEAFVDGNYVDITDCWNSFQRFISASWFRYYTPENRVLATEPRIDENSKCIKFTKDNEVYYGTAYPLTHNAFGGYDGFHVWHDHVMYRYAVSNITLFHRAFGYIGYWEINNWTNQKNTIIKASVYDMMCDSPLLIRKMNRSGDLYYWGQEKYAVVSAIANHYTKTLEQKPDNLIKYGIRRYYTYVYSSITEIDVTLYAQSLWQKGLYAHIRMNDEEVWLVLDTCVKDIQAELNNCDYYKVPALTKDMAALKLNGYDKVTLINNDKEYDITNMWFVNFDNKGLCDWTEYTKAAPLKTDCKIILEKEGEKLVMNVARTYEYAVIEGKGLYVLPHIESIIDAVLQSDLHRAVDTLVKKSVLYKTYRSSFVFRRFFSEESKGYFYKETFQPAQSLIIRYVETLTGKPDIETYKWVEKDFLYKADSIKMTVWRIDDYGDVGYVNLSGEGADIWFKIQDAYMMFSYRGCDAVGNPWVHLNFLPEYTMVPDSMSK